MSGAASGALSFLIVLRQGGFVSVMICFIRGKPFFAGKARPVPPNHDEPSFQLPGIML